MAEMAGENGTVEDLIAVDAFSDEIIMHTAGVANRLASASGGVDDGVAVDGAPVQDGNTTEPNIAGDNPANASVSGEPVPNSMTDQENEEGGDEDEELPELAPWPHDELTDCVCFRPEYLAMSLDKFLHTFREECGMDDDELTEYHALLWEHQRQDWWTTESSYSYFRSTVTNSLAGMDYDLITPKELKTFVLQRGLADPYPSGTTLKYFYLRVLEQADRQWAFDFMRLPTEMRASVYEHQLTFHNHSWRRLCSPAILRTCRQVYEEAKDILYNVNTIHVRFEVEQVDRGQVNKYVSIHNRRETIHCAHGPFYCLPRAIDDYPEFLRRIHRLELQLTYTDSGSVDHFADGGVPLNHFLYTLSSSLMEGHQLKQLCVKLDFPEDHEEYLAEMYLYPILRLRNIADVEITGNISARMAKKIVNDLKSVDVVFNTLRQWQLLEQEAKSQMELLQYLSCGGGCPCGECPIPERASEIMHKMSLLADSKQSCCLNSAHEEQFIARLGMFKRTLEAADLKEVQKLLDTVVARRKHCKDYERVADSGRLLEAMELWKGEVYDDDDAPLERSDHDWSDDETDEVREHEQGVSAALAQQPPMGLDDIEKVFEA